MNTIRDRLGFDPRALVQSLADQGKMSPPPQVIDLIVNKPADDQKLKRCTPRKHNGSRAVLTRHRTRETLPKYGDTRDDGYRFISSNPMQDDKGLYYRENWVRPEVFEERNKKYRNKYK